MRVSYELSKEEVESIAKMDHSDVTIAGDGDSLHFFSNLVKLCQDRVKLKENHLFKSGRRDALDSVPQPDDGYEWSVTPTFLPNREYVEGFLDGLEELASRRVEGVRDFDEGFVFAENENPLMSLSDGEVYPWSYDFFSMIQFTRGYVTKTRADLGIKFQEKDRPLPTYFYEAHIGDEWIYLGEGTEDEACSLLSAAMVILDKGGPTADVRRRASTASAHDDYEPVVFGSDEDSEEADDLPF